MNRDLCIRLRFTRPGLVRAVLLALVFGAPGFIESQMQDEPSRTVTIDTGFSGPVGAFAQLVVSGDAILARNGGAAVFGNPGAVAILTPPAPMMLAGRGVFGQAQDVTAVRYGNSINAVAGAGGLPGLAFANRTAGQRAWALRGMPMPAGSGATAAIWFTAGGAGAAPVPAGNGILGIDDTGRLLVARWAAVCAAGEMPIFGGRAMAGHAGSNFGDVRTYCDDNPDGSNPSLCHCQNPLAATCVMGGGGSYMSLCVAFRNACVPAGSGSPPGCW